MWIINLIIRWFRFFFPKPSPVPVRAKNVQLKISRAGDYKFKGGPLDGMTVYLSDEVIEDVEGFGGAFCKYNELSMAKFIVQHDADCPEKDEVYQLSEMEKLPNAAEKIFLVFNPTSRRNKVFAGYVAEQAQKNEITVLFGKFDDYRELRKILSEVLNSASEYHFAVQTPEDFNEIKITGAKEFDLHNIVFEAFKEAYSRFDAIE